ncbi:hypothetical protein N7492_003712 [Penicillium capsulatum]|uniref:Cyanovirin-N domain-containing protein n=1 Tax=Penicillium capsulatum TaxID=69766 RepID=A0A9W9LXQ0_9EURO|nr:hypothetical protein N7492_003712 [Penicillium capsulatum]KAJ6121707.1 hypothetical protein N7512_004172 [Penicillium capsulatum]
MRAFTLVPFLAALALSNPVPDPVADPAPASSSGVSYPDPSGKTWKVEFFQKSDCTGRSHSFHDNKELKCHNFDGDVTSLTHLHMNGWYLKTFALKDCKDHGLGDGTFDPTLELESCHDLRDPNPKAPKKVSSFLVEKF